LLHALVLGCLGVVNLLLDVGDTVVDCDVCQLYEGVTRTH
jgi:hypothetical protein